ncbi:MAG: glycoside hydrolase family 95 protein, partial [Patescibacteria group bacterium]|nr:glycoside hydrolase family 95 protein [Patescibacteria group bacterium]
MIRLQSVAWGQLFFLLVLGAMLQEAGAVDGGMTPWYTQAATRWEEALPLGNGRLGAMVFGGTDKEVGKERLQLNEESLWAGRPFDTYPAHFAENLRKVQSLVLEGKIAEAHELGLRGLTESPTSFRSYEPLADLWIEMSHAGPVDEYRRELSLETGLARVTYRAGGVRFRREAFISAVDDVLAVRLSVAKPGALRAAIRLTRPKDAVMTASGQNRL